MACSRIVTDLILNTRNREIRRLPLEAPCGWWGGGFGSQHDAVRSRASLGKHWQAMTTLGELQPPSPLHAANELIKACQAAVPRQSTGQPGKGRSSPRLPVSRNRIAMTKTSRDRHPREPEDHPNQPCSDPEHARLAKTSPRSCGLPPITLRSKTTTQTPTTPSWASRGPPVHPVGFLFFSFLSQGQLFHSDRPRAEPTPTSPEPGWSQGTLVVARSNRPHHPGP